MPRVSPSKVSLYTRAWRYVLPRESDTVNTWLVFPARITTAIQLPAVLFELKESVEELVVPASLLTCCTREIGPARD